MKTAQNQRYSTKLNRAEGNAGQIGGSPCSSLPVQMIIKTLEGDKTVLVEGEAAPKVGSHLSSDAFGDGNKYYVSGVIASDSSTNPTPHIIIIVEIDRRNYRRLNLESQ